MADERCFLYTGLPRCVYCKSVKGMGKGLAIVVGKLVMVGVRDVYAT